jgi:hypothetical protein
MPTYTLLEISWDQLEWSDVLKLLQASARASSIDVRRCGTHIYASVDALRSGNSREAWLKAARKLEFSPSFVALAEWAAGNGVSLLCAVQGREVDPAVPFQRVPLVGTPAGMSPGCRPPRFVICEGRSPGCLTPMTKMRSAGSRTGKRWKSLLFRL